jgi:hypothetical protein
MKQFAIFFLLLGVTTFSAAAPGHPDDHPITVHVSASHWSVMPGISFASSVQTLDVVIDGRKFELAASTGRNDIGKGIRVLALGDYKAKLVIDTHDNVYESCQAYELVLPDQKNRKFFVIGQSE